MADSNAISATDEQEMADTCGSNLPDILYDVVARAATTSFGRYVNKRIENLLWMVEKTARWSLPQPSPITDENVKIDAKVATVFGTEETSVGENIPAPALTRPLPWWLFLPALIVLRLIRIGLSMGARLIGRGPVLPLNVVSFLQNKRRKLRALKYRGQRLQRISRNEMSSEGQETAAPWLERIIMPLKMVICSKSYRSADVNSDTAHAIVFHKDNTSTTTNRRLSKKRNLAQREAESTESEASDDNSTEGTKCEELLEKYAYMEEDSSFNVEDVSSTSDSYSQSDSDPSPKKLNIETGAQQSTSKTETLKRSASENNNGLDAQLVDTNAIIRKSVHFADRSKSAAELGTGDSPQNSREGFDDNIANTLAKVIPNHTVHTASTVHQPQQHISNGGRNRNKKASTQSAS